MRLRHVLPIFLIATVALACDGGGTKSSDKTPTKVENADQAETKSSGEANVEPKAEAPIREPSSLGTPPSGSEPTLPALDGFKALAADLAKERDGDYFSHTVRDNPSNGPAFLWLALHSLNPIEAAAALRNLDRIYGTSERHREVDDELRAVVLYRLASDVPMIAEAAFEAANLCVNSEPANAEIVAALVHFAVHHPKPAGRILAIEALTPRWDPTSDVQDAILHALEEPDPAFLALTLEQISFNFGHRVSKHAALMARIEPLLKHRDPGVRGAAVAAFAESSLGHDEGEVAAKLLPFIKDPHPFVRATVLEELSKLHHLPALPTLLAHVDHADPSNLQLKWAGLDGIRTTERLLTRFDKTIGLVAQRSLERLTRGTEHPFKRSGVGQDSDDSGLARGAEEARAWYEAHGEALVP